MNDQDKPQADAGLPELPAEFTAEVAQPAPAAAPTTSTPAPAPVAPVPGSPEEVRSRIAEPGTRPLTAEERAEKKAPYRLNQTTGKPLFSEKLPEYDETEAEAAGHTPDAPRVNPQVHQEEEVLIGEEKPLHGNKEFIKLAEAGEPLLPVYSERSTEADSRIVKYVSSATFSSVEGREWNQILGNSSATATSGMMLDAAATRKNSDWRQYIGTPAGKVAYSAPKIPIKEGERLTGAKAMLQVRAIMGMGGTINVPLPHSGFSITLQAPRESSLIELHRRIIEEKIELGRMTQGLIFSNEQSYLMSIMMEFCLEHVYNSSLQLPPSQSYMDHIRAQDSNILLNGMARLIWPSGFNHVRSIVTREGIQNHATVTGKINLAKLLWVDNAGLTAKQSAQMYRRNPNCISPADMEAYHKDFFHSNGQRVEIHEGLALLLKVPTLTDVVQDGTNWISNIVNVVDSTFTQTAPDPAARNEQIHLHARAMSLRRWGGWVAGVEINGELVEEADVVYNTLDVLSVDTKAAAKVEAKIKEFINDSTVAMIAIPETSDKENPLPRFPNLVAMDVINAFFILLSQRIMRLV